MNQEYYIGQIFEGKYPPSAACWCNANQAYIDVIGDHRYEIKAIPPAPAPTKEEQQEKRHEAYVKEVDGLHAQKMRHEILGDWTEEDETAYREKVIRLSEEIAQRFPYPVE